MGEVFQILAHDKQVHQLLVNDFELTDNHPGVRVERAKGELNGLTGNRQVWFANDFQRIFDPLGNFENQLHPAARAKAWLVGTDVWIHWTDPVFIATIGLGRACLPGAQGDSARQREKQNTAIEMSHFCSPTVIIAVIFQAASQVLISSSAKLKDQEFLKEFHGRREEDRKQQAGAR